MSPSPLIVGSPVKIMAASTTAEGQEWALIGWADMVEVVEEPKEEELFFVGEPSVLSGPQTVSMSFRLRPNDEGYMYQLLTGQTARKINGLISKHFPR
jgi:hypothetical protein